MHWTAVFLAGYATCFVEIWRLCDQAPVAPEDYSGDL